MEFPQFQVDGKFSKDRYNALLRSSGLSEAQFEAELKTEPLIEQLQNGVVDSAFVTPHELDRRYALEKQEREVDYALIRGERVRRIDRGDGRADPEVVRRAQVALSAA